MHPNQPTTTNGGHRAALNRAAGKRDRLMRDEHIIHLQNAPVERDRIECFNGLRPGRSTIERDRRAWIGVDQHDIGHRWQPPPLPVRRIVPVTTERVRPLNGNRSARGRPRGVARQTKPGNVSDRLAAGTRRPQCRRSAKRRLARCAHNHTGHRVMVDLLPGLLLKRMRALDDQVVATETGALARRAHLNVIRARQQNLLLADRGIVAGTTVVVGGDLHTTGVAQRNEWIHFAVRRLDADRDDVALLQIESPPVRT